ncbi:hypothetical protein [Achromobacter xylosoxidans]|uniref:hypothetical protein n=1 Tax=Alcaligenes xylosoxydans xylosoxydans TaxID=85698 RepID=UPI00244D35D9|nr:hypothetical protein [Achromobacter xylosoxidans]MDH0520828.1 hypothetical protein [Achromobacter xylosoxidans]MDH0544800.1 hypothetical protein [Achromobacter xylosoxidans]
MKENNAAQAVEQDPINAAILLLTEEADSISDCHTRTLGDWAGEPEAKAHYDHVRSVVDALSKLRAPVADERALDLLDTLFTAYESGTPCYEEPDSQGGYLGMAFRIDDDTFRACADLLNKHRPRAALASAPVADERAAVAYLDLGAGGYMDVGTDLTDEQLAALPKGRHMLAIIGTHGVNGYAPASASVADAWQQYALLGETTAEQVCKRLDEEVTRRTVDAMRRSDDAQESRDEIERLRAALASAPVADRQRLRELVDVVWNEATESTAVPDTPWADRLIDKVFPSLAASAPVAGEAQPSRQTLLDAIWRHGNARAMAEHNIAYRDEVRNTADALIALFDAAPQAGAENALMAPADVAQLVAFIFDRFGQPGDAGALPDNVAAAVRRLERGIKTQADKDGGQQPARQKGGQ